MEVQAYEKTLSFILAAALGFGTFASAFAANGDVAGKIYSTDIKTYFRGKELKSYSLNGKTAVAVEDLGANSNVNFSDMGG